jgi:hypothetical protein
VCDGGVCVKKAVGGVREGGRGVCTLQDNLDALGGQSPGFIQVDPVL